MVAVGGIARWNQSILLIRRGQPPEAGRWSVPGGRVEMGETLVEALEREMWEETGLTVDCGRFVGWVELMGPGWHYIVLDFEVALRDPDMAGTAVCGGDAVAVRWVPLSDIDGLDLVSGLRHFLGQHGILPEPMANDDPDSARP
jgi:8-oxo-dGTP diphosphatase